MSLSNNNVIAFLLDINRNIEEYADATVKKIFVDRNPEFLTYPPNGGLTEMERSQLNKLENNDDLKNALRKVIADNTAGVIFDMLNLLDGTTTPKLASSQWKGLKLVDEEEDEIAEPFEDMLHGSLFDVYWE